MTGMSVAAEVPLKADESALEPKSFRPLPKPSFAASAHSIREPWQRDGRLRVHVQCCTVRPRTRFLATHKLVASTTSLNRLQALNHRLGEARCHQALDHQRLHRGGGFT